MPKWRSGGQSAEGKRQNVFTSRGPRNAEEIDTCLAMLEDSPYWASAHYTLDRSEVVNVWTDLLSTGCGYIDIVENGAYVPQLERYKGGSGRTPYGHAFCTVQFIAYVTFEFAREIIMQDDIADINLHFLEAMIRHRTDASCPSPAMTAEEVRLGLTQAPGRGLYCCFALVRHPGLQPLSIIISSPQIMERYRRSMLQHYGGSLHHAWISNAVSQFDSYGFSQFGHQLLREHPTNKAKAHSEKKYVYCETNSRETSEALGVRANLTVNMDDERFLGNFCKNVFDGRQPSAGLNKKEQETCYLLTLGYTSEQIAKVLSTTVGSIDQYQNKAGQKLYDAGYHGVASGFHKEGGLPKCSRETISRVIFDNLHEVRSDVLPLYPWPEGLFER